MATPAQQQEIIKWNEFVKVSRQNGLSDADITSRLERAHVSAEVIAILLNSNLSTHIVSTAVAKYKWMLVVGIIKLVLGIPLLLLFLSAGQMSLAAVGLILTGIGWIATYTAKKNA
jgi:hypothetical protein